MHYCDTNLNPIEGYAPGASSTLFFHIAGFFMNQGRFVTIDEPRTTVTGKGLAMIPNVTWVQHGPSQTSFDSFLTLLTQTQRAWWREALWCHQKVPFRSAYWPPFPGWNTVMLDHWLGLHFWAIFLVVRGLCSMRQAARGGTSAIFLRRVLYARYAVCLRETLPGPCEEEHFHMFGAFFDGHIFMASPWWSLSYKLPQTVWPCESCLASSEAFAGWAREWVKNTVSNQNSWNTYAQLPRSKIVKMDPGFAYVNCLCQGFLASLREANYWFGHDGDVGLLLPFGLVGACRLVLGNFIFLRDYCCRPPTPGHLPSHPFGPSHPYGPGTLPAQTSSTKKSARNKATNNQHHQHQQEQEEKEGEQEQKQQEQQQQQQQQHEHNVNLGVLSICHAW